MAYSAATYKGDGSQSTFMIPFDYLQKDFVKVTINEVDKVYAQDYRVDGRELSFPTAPPSGSIIKIYRETPIDRMVKWNEGSVLTSSNMTTQQIQELHLIEETTYNLNISSMIKTEDNGHKWEGQYLPITHVGDPTDDSDAVNLGTIKKEETGFLASVRSQLDTWLADLGVTYNNYSKSLKDSFDSYTSNLKNQFDTHTASLLKDFNDYKDTLKNNYDTYTSNLSATFNDYKDTLLNKYNEYLASLTATKDAVKDSEANANKYKDEAKSASASAKESASQCADSVATCTTRVTEANRAKESASASANTATTKATESGNSASLAKKWAISAESPDGAVGSKSAKTWAEEAKASEQKATTSANNAKASEDNAKISEVNAKSSETASANSATASAKSATAAKASEGNAKTSEINAKASEVAAAESARQAAADQINADWNVTDTTSKAYIKNKPEVYPNAEKIATTGYERDLINAKVADSDKFRLRVGGSSNKGWVELATGDDAEEPIYVRQYTWGTEIDGVDPYFGHLRREAALLDASGNTYFPGTVTAPTFSGLASKATADAAGNDIQATYAKKSDLSSSVSTTSLTVSGETSVPTANEGNSSNSIASTEFVAKSLAKLVDSAPESLNTLNELAKALGNDPNFATTIVNELAKKLNSTEAENTYVKQGGVNLWNALHNNTTSNLKGLTNAQWNALGFFIRYFAGVTAFENQPSTYGQLINIPADTSSESTQLWIEQWSGKIYARGGNGSNAVKDEVFKQMAFFNRDGHLTFPNDAEMWVY